MNKLTDRLKECRDLNFALHCLLGDIPEIKKAARCIENVALVLTERIYSYESAGDDAELNTNEFAWFLENIRILSKHIDKCSDDHLENFNIGNSEIL